MKSLKESSRGEQKNLKNSRLCVCGWNISENLKKANGCLEFLLELKINSVNGSDFVSSCFCSTDGVVPKGAASNFQSQEIATHLIYWKSHPVFIPSQSILEIHRDQFRAHYCFSCMCANIISFINIVNLTFMWIIYKSTAQLSSVHFKLD